MHYLKNKWKVVGKYDINMKSNQIIWDKIQKKICLKLKTNCELWAEEIIKLLNLTKFITKIHQENVVVKIFWSVVNLPYTRINFSWDRKPAR